METVATAESVTIQLVYCTRCRRHHPPDEFKFTTSTGIRIMRRCLNCRQLDAQQTASRKRKALESIPEEGTKVCSKCLYSKPVEEFKVEEELFNTCLQCRESAYYREITPQRKQYQHDYHINHYQLGDSKESDVKMYIKQREMIDKMKVLMGGCCKQCQEARSFLLEFDHIKGVKICNVTECKTWSKILTEAAKCQLLCIRCHRVKTNPDYDETEGWTCPMWAKRKIKVAQLKRSNGCGHCKVQVSDTWPVSCFDMDHINRNGKIGSISHLICVLRAREEHIFNAELKKCQVLCCHCHKLRTLGQLAVYIKYINVS